MGADQTRAIIATHMYPGTPAMQGNYAALLPHQKRRVDDLYNALFTKEEDHEEQAKT